MCPYLLCAILLGPLAGWLASRRPMPFRFFALHPWLVAWLGSFVLTGSVLLFVDILGARATSLTILPVYVSLLVVALATVQGLRVTWLRSWRKGAVVLFGFLLFTYVETISIPRDAADFSSHLYAAISLAPSWAFAAWIAHRVGRRCAAQSISSSS